MGSPDSHGRQLNGMGSGVSSTSKVCVVTPSQQGDADVDYTFVQVDIRTGDLDFAGNCGNMSSAIGPVALDTSVVRPQDVFLEPGLARVRIFNTNTSKIIHSTFATHNRGDRFQSQGDFKIDGVPGTGSQIALSFMSPTGSKTGSVLPTGNVTDPILLTNGRQFSVSLVDVTTPVVYVRGSDVDVEPGATPAEMEVRSGLMDVLEQIRRSGAIAMGLTPVVSGVPKLVILMRPQRDVHIEARAISMQQPHRAIPVTAALNLGAVSGIQGTPPAQASLHNPRETELTIGHPSGSIKVSCTRRDGVIESVSVYRTARILMRGDVMLQ